jgi:energy-coupling factor transporter transmembrane protein EcfT
VWVTLYIFILSIAIILFIIGIVFGDLVLLAPSIALFILAGFYSFNLTYITDSGSVLQLSGGEYVLAFIWWGFAITGIIAVMLYGLTGFRGEKYAG